MREAIQKLEKAGCQWAMIIAFMQASTLTQAKPSNFPRPDFPVPDGTIFSLLATNNVIYLGGDFQIVANQSRPYLAALDVQDGKLLDWQPDILESVSAMAASGTTLYVGLYALGPVRHTNAIDAFDIRTALRSPGWQGYVFVFGIPQITTRVNTLALGHGRLYVGGEWTGRFIYALEPTSGAVLAWNPDQFEAYGVDTIGVVGNTVYAGGGFPKFQEQPQARTNLAALDRDTAAALAWDPAPDGRVRSLVASGNSLYVGGEFTAIGGQPRNGLAAIDLITGNVTPWDPCGTNANAIRAMALIGNTLYVAGTFQKIGGQSRTNLAALDVTTGAATSWNPSVTNRINALVVSGDTVFVGGGLEFPVNGSTSPFLGVFPPEGWSLLSQARHTNGHFSFRLLGEEGSNYVIEASATLTNWSSVYTNTVANGGFDFTEPATNASLRFYRARTQP